MPTPEDEAFIRESLTFYGDKSPYWDERVKAAEASSQRRLAAYVEFHGDRVYTEEPEQTALAAFEFLNRSREVLGLPTLPRMPNIDRLVHQEGAVNATGFGGGIAKGVRAGAMSAAGLINTISPLATQEDAQRAYAQADTLGSETTGVPAKLGSMIGRTGTEMAPLIVGGMGLGAAVRAIPAVARIAATLPGAIEAGKGFTAGQNVVRAIPGAISSVGAGVQSGASEYASRSTEGHADAGKLAILKALSTTGFTAASAFLGADPVSIVTNPLKRKLLQEAAKNTFLAMGKSLGMNALKEGASEGADQLASSAIDKWIAGDAVTIEQAMTDAAMAAGLGALFGAGFDAPGAMASKLANERRSEAKARDELIKARDELTKAKIKSKADADEAKAKAEFAELAALHAFVRPPLHTQDSPPIPIGPLLPAPVLPPEPPLPDPNASLLPIGPVLPAPVLPPEPPLPDPNASLLPIGPMLPAPVLPPKATPGKQAATPADIKIVADARALIAKLNQSVSTIKVVTKRVQEQEKTTGTPVGAAVPVTSLAVADDILARALVGKATSSELDELIKFTVNQSADLQKTIDSNPAAAALHAEAQAPTATATTAAPTATAAPIAEPTATAAPKPIAPKPIERKPPSKRVIRGDPADSIPKSDLVKAAERIQPYDRTAEEAAAVRKWKNEVRAAREVNAYHNLLDSAQTGEQLQHATQGSNYTVGTVGAEESRNVKLDPIKIEPEEIADVKERLAGHDLLSPQARAHLDDQQPAPARPAREMPPPHEPLKEDLLSGRIRPPTDAPTTIKKETKKQRNARLKLGSDQAEAQALTPQRPPEEAEATLPSDMDTALRLTPEEEALIVELQTTNVSKMNPNTASQLLRKLARRRLANARAEAARLDRETEKEVRAEIAPPSEPAFPPKLPEVERHGDTFNVNLETLDYDGWTKLIDGFAELIRANNGPDARNIAVAGENSPEAIRESSFAKIAAEYQGKVGDLPILEYTLTERGSTQYIEMKAKGNAIVSKIIESKPAGELKVRIAPGETAKLPAFVAPNSWTPMIDEYLALHSRLNISMPVDAARLAKLKAETNVAPKDWHRLSTEQKDAYRLAKKERDKLAKQAKKGDPLSSEEIGRIHSLSAAIRSYMAESVARHIVDLIAAKAKSERRTTARRFINIIEQKLVGFKQDFASIVGGQGLVDPHTLNDVHSRRNIVKLPDGQYGLAVRDKHNRWSLADTTGKAFVTSNTEAEPEINPSDTSRIQEITSGKKRRHLRSLAELDEPTTDPHATDALGIVALSQEIALVSPKVQHSINDLAFMSTNGLTSSVENTNYKLGELGPTIGGETPQRSRGEVDATKIPYRPGQDPTSWIESLLVSDVGTQVTYVSGKRVYAGKWINKAALDKVLANIPGGKEAMSELLNDGYNRVAVGKHSDTKTPIYKSGKGALAFRQAGTPVLVANPIMSDTGTPLPSLNTILEDAGAASSFATTSGDQGPGIAGSYNWTTAMGVMAQADPDSFIHEWAHHMTLPLFLGDTPILPDSTALTQLHAAAALSPNGNVNVGEGLAVLAELYARQPAEVEAQFPDALAYLNDLLVRVGQKSQFDTVTKAYQAYLKASPAQRAASRVKSRVEFENDESRYAQLPYSVRIKNELDASSSFEGTRGMLHTAYANDASTFHNIAMQSDAAASDQWWNGLLTKSGMRYEGSFGSARDAMVRWAAENGVDFKQVTAFINSLAMFDRNPALRTKYGIDESIGWTDKPNTNPTGVQIGGQTIDTSTNAGAVYANTLIKAKYEAQLLQAKLGKQKPPPPPSYLDEHANQADNETPQDLESAAGTIEKFKDTDLMDLVKNDWKTANDSMARWKAENALITPEAARKHLETKFYMPLPTELLNKQAKGPKGSRGQDYLDGWDRLDMDLQSSMHRKAQNDVGTAHLRAVMLEAARRRDTGGVALKRDGDPIEIGELGHFEAFQDALERGRRETDDALPEDSAIKGEYVYVRLDRPTIEAIIDSGHMDEEMAQIPPGEKGYDPDAWHQEVDEIVEKYSGQMYAYRIKNKTIRESMNMTATSPLPVHWLWRLPATMVRNLAITLNPEQWVRGFLRDFISGPIQTGKPLDIVRHPLKYGESTAEGAKAAWKATAPVSERGQSTDAINDALVGMGVGGQSSQNEYPSVVTETQHRQALSWIGHTNPVLRVLRGMARISDTAELTNRIAVARRVIMAEIASTGKTFAEIQKSDPKLAQYALAKGFRAAQEIGVNFRKTGTNAAFRQYTAMVPFLNPGIQGLLASMRALSGQSIDPDADNSPASRLMRATASATVLMIPAMVQMLLLHEGSDEDKKRFNELPDSERLKYYHMATKNGFVRYPKPQGLYTGAITAIEGVFMSDPRTWGQVSRDVLSESVPQSLIPTTLQLGWELWAGERIGSTAGYASIPAKLKGVEDAETRDAPAVAEAISALGLRVKSPMAIENLISGYTGGLGWALMDAPQAVQDMLGADTRAAYTPANYPITRLMAYKDPTWNKRTISTFYDMMADLSAQSMTVKDKEKQVAENRMTVEEMITHLKQHPKLLFGAAASDALKSVAQDFSEARTYYERINRDTALSEVERRQKMDDLMDKITDAARLATEKVKEAAEKNGVKLAWQRR